MLCKKHQSQMLYFIFVAFKCVLPTKIKYYPFIYWRVQSIKYFNSMLPEYNG